MLKRLFLTLPCLLAISASYAGSTFTTSTGAVFTQAMGPGTFGQGWKDPSGIIWGSYQGSYANSGSGNTTHPNGVVVDSPAIEVCKGSGGSLPSSQDYAELISHFESQFNLLTSQGEKDLVALFPDMQQTHWFWTSTLSSDNVNNGVVFNTDVGFITSLYTYNGTDYPFPLISTYGVRCIDQ